ncbi:MAG: hypothetical protein GX639_21190 [Fibrobacter sp.]|nr:hypothetical protein [Fibrobacter sp.]
MGATSTELAKAISQKPNRIAGSRSSGKIWNSSRRAVKKVPRVRHAKASPNVSDGTTL